MQILDDHMIREEAYYIMKVLQNAGQAAELRVDPTAPRVTDINIWTSRT